MLHFMLMLLRVNKQLNIYHHSDGVKVIVLIILPSIYK